MVTWWWAVNSSSPECLYFMKCLRIGPRTANKNKLMITTDCKSHPIKYRDEETLSVHKKYRCKFGDVVQLVVIT